MQKVFKELRDNIKGILSQKDELKSKVRSDTSMTSQTMKQM
jgi:hypothetical protein